jgi:hypothetical protein
VLQISFISRIKIVKQKSPVKSKNFSAAFNSSLRDAVHECLHIDVNGDLKDINNIDYTAQLGKF